MGTRNAAVRPVCGGRHMVSCESSRTLRRPRVSRPVTSDFLTLIPVEAYLVHSLLRPANTNSIS